MSQDRWQDVKAKVEGLGLKLKLHLEQEQEHEAEGDEENVTGQTQAAIEEMGAKLQDAVNSLGNAAKDPAIRSDLKDLGELLRDAMNETFSTVGAEVGGILKKTKGQMASGTDDVKPVVAAPDDAASEDWEPDDAAPDDAASDDAAPDDAASDDASSDDSNSGEA